jgi:hypothetical protein
MFHAELMPPSIIQLHTREDAVRLASDGRIAPNALIYAVFRKAGQETLFHAPIQGYYSGRLSAEMNDAWRSLRYLTPVGAGA